MSRHQANRLLAGTLVVSLLVLPACSTIDPYTGEQQTSKAATGAAIGAVAGAILGAATGDKKDRKERVLKGAGIGAIAGGGVGLYMDKQEAKLREQLQGSGVSVTRSGDNIILNMPSNITFEVDSFALRSEFTNVLNSVALVLNEYKSTLVTIAGHTDSTGSDAYNMDLSQKRALTVGEYLQGQKVALERLAATGYGETRPIATNDTPEGRALNRRVEITLDPISQ
jgi:outer membrane protein OmpA-like peptidoglycan-associated protein